MKDEVAIAFGEHVLAALWDVKKFYDRIDVQRLIEDAERDLSEEPEPESAAAAVIASTLALAVVVVVLS